MSFKKYMASLAASLMIIAAVPQAASAEQIQKETMYRIFVDRFNNGTSANDEGTDVNDPESFHGGDLTGVTAKLDHLDAIGMTAIVLSPIMKNAPKGYHGYWVEDFTEIDPHFGTEADWKELVKKAHDKNMKIILEMSPGYIGETSQIAKDSKKSNWLKSDKPVGQESWKQKAVALDLSNKEAANMVKDASVSWLNKGADGIMIQDASVLPRDFLQDFTANLKRKKSDAYIIAELDQQTKTASDIENMEQIDAVVDSRVEQRLDKAFGTLSGQLDDEAFPDKSVLYVDSPWTERFAQIAGENDRNGTTAWNLALTYLYTAPGVPMILQGSELPMYGKTPAEVQRLVDFNSGDQDFKESFERYGALRKQFPALTEGEFKLISNKDNMYVFKRWTEEETLYIAINNDGKSHAAKITDLDEGLQLKGLLGDNLSRASDNGDYTITLPRETAEVYVVSEDKGINWFLIVFIIGVMVVFVGAIIMLSRKQKRHAS